MKNGKRTVLIIIIVLIALLFVLFKTGLPPIRPIQVIAPDPSIPRHYDYFGIESVNAIPRQIARIEGTFTLDCRIEPALFTVRDGDARNQMSFVCGRSPNAFPHVHWSPVELKLALGDEKTNGVTMTSLGCAGMQRATGAPWAITNDIQASHSSLLTGSVRRKHEYIVYVEGDHPFTTERMSSPKEFAQNNPTGNFLVVSIYVH